jgi:hypothetical protein
MQVQNMPNTELVNRILDLREDATPTEQLVLKLAASLILQIDDPFEPADNRLALTKDEANWLPEVWESYRGMVRPKRWAIPERLAHVEKENQAISDIMAETSLSRRDATLEYIRRSGYDVGNAE